MFMNKCCKYVYKKEGSTSYKHVRDIYRVSATEPKSLNPLLSDMLGVNFSASASGLHNKLIFRRLRTLESLYRQSRYSGIINIFA